MNTICFKSGVPLVAINQEKRVLLDEMSGVECYFSVFPRVAINNVVDCGDKEEKE